MLVQRTALGICNSTVITPHSSSSRGQRTNFPVRKKFMEMTDIFEDTFAIWKSTSSSGIKHNKTVPEFIRLIRLRVVGVLEIYPSN